MITFITTADTEILTLSRALATLPPELSEVCAANPNSLADPRVLERFLTEQVASSSVVIMRLLRGKRAFDPGFHRVVECCRQHSIPHIALPGDLQTDLELDAVCTVPTGTVAQTYSYLLHGGPENLANLLLYLSDQFSGTSFAPPEPRELPWDGIYHPAWAPLPDPAEYLSRQFMRGRAAVGLIFYRAHWMSTNLEFVDALVHALEARGANVLPVFCYSLRTGAGAAGTGGVLERYFMGTDGRPLVDCLVNTLSMAMARIEVEGPSVAAAWSVEELCRLDLPVLQAILSTGGRAEWEQSAAGLSPLDTAMNVAMPEFDGRIITVPISFKEVAGGEAKGPARQYVPEPDRVDFLARLACKWATLRRKPNAEKKIAIILSNYPSRNARIGNAVGLDTPASTLNLLRAMQAAGFQTGSLPQSGDELIHGLIDRCTFDREFTSAFQLAQAPGHVPEDLYARWFTALPIGVQQEMRDAWGSAPGTFYRHEGAVVVPGLLQGNVFVGVQPPRGFGENPIAIYHSPDLVPPHHYIAYYRWIRDVFQADAIVHLGKHGTLEWLPGKGLGLSARCYPEVALSDLPNFYPYIVNNPGEGTQAKRRAHATIIDHLIPPMTTADSYNEITHIEQLMDEYYQVQTLDPRKVPIIREQLWDAIVSAQLHRDLDTTDRPDDFDGFLTHLDGYLCEIKDAQIRDGLHVLGEAPTGEQLVGLLLALTRLDNVEAPSLREALATALGLSYQGLIADRGLPVSPSPRLVAQLGAEVTPRTTGDLIEQIDRLGHTMMEELVQQDFSLAAIPSIVDAQLGASDEGVTLVLGYVARTLQPRLQQTSDEITNTINGLGGSYVPAGPSGAPTRGMAHVLPTGRNFYSVDPKTLPSPAAWQVGQHLADALIKKYVSEEGTYPQSVGLVIWGTSAMRTHGDDVAEVLSLLGVRPVWQAENRRVIGLEVIPLAELGRPRVDVTVRISGFFRDAFPNLIHLLDHAFALVADLDEPPEMNLIKSHVQTECERLTAEGLSAVDARQHARFRVFGSKPGTYGAGIQPLLDAGNWETVDDLAAVYATWGAYAYTREIYGTNAPKAFNLRFGQIQIAAKNQDNREHDIFDSGDYFQDHGGMIATVRALSGQSPKQMFGDSANPQNVHVRDLDDEARRVLRARVVNPKWIKSILRHGYKGASELAATVENLFGYDATAGIVDDWMYERVTDSYVLDEAIQRFFQEKNPWALRDIAHRLLEAAERGLWQCPDQERLEQVRRIVLKLEGDLEDRHSGK